MLKKYINEFAVEDMPQSGVIIVERKGDSGEPFNYETGISNLPHFFENNLPLAHKNGYYEFVEQEPPEYNSEAQCITAKYTLENDIILQHWIVTKLEE